MIFVVVILFVAFILIPLLDLVLKANILYAAKIIVYAVAVCWFIYAFFIAHGGPM
jgi:hypothetical protein